MSEDAKPQAFGDLLDQARAGNRSALSRLLARIEPQLLTEADRRLGDRLRAKTRASDVLQDAYVEVVQGISGFAGTTEESFLSWVTTIIESSARQQHRYLNAQRRRAPTHTSQLGALAREILGTTRSPATELEQAEAIRLVMEAVQSLREDYRVVIDQTVMNKRSIDDVARDLGRSKDATSMLLSRARAALLREIEKRDRTQRAP